MATTTNYSWSTPDDTALVKDGAAAIRTLGSSADTTVKALNPGTTAGDIDYYTTSTAKARVAIGTAGQVLAVNSGATAPEWITSSSGGMTLISTTTISNNATVSLTSIPQTYNSLYVVIRNYKPATNFVGLQMRFNGDSGSNRHRGELFNTTGSYTGALQFNATSSKIATLNDNATATGLITITIPDYTNTSTWKIAPYTTISVDSPTTADFLYLSGSAAYNQTTAISSLDFLSASGNLTSGTILLYGVK
jgi:hypothetical protein